MDPANLQQLVEELRFDEGVRYWPYADTNGAQTVGVGHNLTASALPEGWNYPLTDEQIDELLQSDLQTVFTELDSALPWWNLLSDVRQRVIANMCFNLGITKLLGFRSTLTAMRQGRYSDAATGMLNSAWASQVGARATRLANMMLTGVTQ